MSCAETERQVEMERQIHRKYQRGLLYPYPEEVKRKGKDGDGHGEKGRDQDGFGVSATHSGKGRA